MTITLILLIYLGLSILDLIPLLHQKDNKVITMFLVLGAIALLLVVLDYLGINVPSPSTLIRVIVHRIYGV